MAITVKGLDRVFKYGDRELSDPDSSMSPDEVMNFYANTYPELTTSNVHGPEIEDMPTKGESPANYIVLRFLMYILTMHVWEVLRQSLLKK